MSKKKKTSNFIKLFRLVKGPFGGLVLPMIIVSLWSSQSPEMTRMLLAGTGMLIIVLLTTIIMSGLILKLTRGSWDIPTWPSELISFIISRKGNFRTFILWIVIFATTIAIYGNKFYRVSEEAFAKLLAHPTTESLLTGILALIFVVIGFKLLLAVFKRKLKI